jgi:hypothetical protein
MPSAIPKPIAMKRSRKPAAVLRSSEPSRKEPPAAAVAISREGFGIAELAQELAELQSVCTRLANAEGPAERACDEAAARNFDAEDHSDACKAVRDFEDVGRRALGMVNALQQLMLTLEPRTPDETLSLALVLAEQLDTYFGEHIDRTNCAAQVEARRLEDTLHAVIRGLVGAGATSPLTEAYSTAAMLRPWAQARSDATRAAGPYLVTYNPAKGRLEKVEAAQ